MYILAILCVVYFIFLIIYCGMTSRFYFFWLALGSVFALLAVNNKTHWLKVFPNWVMKLVGVLICIGAGIFAITEALIISGCFAEGRDNLDYVIVLGAGVKEDGRPSNALKKRIDEAFYYYQNNKNTILVVSGGKGYDEPISEAECMFSELVKRGVPQTQIVLENESVNTSQNLRFSRILIPEDKSVGIISNNFHVFRAVHIAQKAGFKDVVGIAAKGDIPTAPNNFVREFFGVMKDLVFFR